MPADTPQSPGGITRGPFLVAVAALALATAAAGWWLGFFLFSLLGWPLAGLWLLAMALRLKNIGVSPWLLAVAVFGIAGAGMVAAVIGIFVMGFAGVDDGMALAGIGFWVTVATVAALWLAFLAWLAVIPAAPSRRAP